MSSLKKNEIVNLDITALSNEGNGIGRHEGQVVFVPATAVGDKIKAKIVFVRRNHAYGRLEEILTPSAERIENDCPSFPRCGGCSLRHISYTAECVHKEDLLVGNLERIGKLSPQLSSFVPSPVEVRYRNKVQLPLRKEGNGTVFGFFAPRSHRLIPMEDCLLQPEVFSALGAELCRFMDEHNISAYDEVAHKGLVRHLYLRIAEKTGEIMAVVVLNGRKLPQWEKLLKRWQKITPIKTFLLNHNPKKTNVITGKEYTTLFGPGVIVDEMLGVKLELSPDSFYQINYHATELLYQNALEYADPSPDDVLVDLYCGVGAIGLTMAYRVKQLIGIEIVPEAVEDAKKNAKLNGIFNAEFLCMDATKAAKHLIKEKITPQIVVIDPPRKGVDAEALDAIVTLQPEKIVYISCNTATLARDCKILKEKGYEITRGRGVDLFPRTPHVEAVLLLERAKH